MIDLHMHTNYSDGTCSVAELLKEAEEKRLECISITDHDTCLAYNDLKDDNIRNLYSGKIIKGTEIKSIVDGTVIEILGYNVDTEYLNEVLPKFAPTYEQINMFEYEKLLKIYKEKGFIINEKNVVFNPKNQSGQTALTKELLSHPENSRFIEETNYIDEHVFYRTQMSNPRSSYFVDDSEIIPKPEDVVSLIHKAGGLAFIPHTFIYGENSMKVLDKLTEKHLVDGIECYYSKFTKEQIEYLLKFCKNNNYYISGGTDYHGTFKPGIKMGTGINNNLEIPLEIIKPWAKIRGRRLKKV